MAAKDDYDTALSAAATAFGTSDYTEARKQVGVAQIHLARMSKSAGFDGASHTKQAISDLEQLVARIDAAERRANKFEIHSTWVP